MTRRYEYAVFMSKIDNRQVVLNTTTDAEHIARIFEQIKAGISTFEYLYTTDRPTGLRSR